jgi:hypothetical protein
LMFKWSTDDLFLPSPWDFHEGIFQQAFYYKKGLRITPQTCLIILIIKIEKL